ncbi:SusC/RagA family TonB-linked outer membrane protein [Bacteroides ovatus]|uniref:SusC/RagA family TonB-linked outer membrane protein n=2 Tax=Bacteroides ovatus TaxID=28116 RepID=UPI0018996A28|nr:TonB-dependent receptor [Bacteroides ovatus]MDC2624420.1 TonB-dependent receptor [Bacteroides ovatus]MDC2638289.1 TonB-dependent receptor [Bacteroides ovatus]
MNQFLFPQKKTSLFVILVALFGFNCSILKGEARNGIKEVGKSIDNQQVVAKSILVNGTVIGTDKIPIPGVLVQVEGTDIAIVTDIDGHYNINVPDKKAVLVFKFLGYEDTKVIVGNQININVTLKESLTELDEVTVVGFGIQKKLSVIGSIENLEPTQLQLGTNRSLSNNLAGQLSGVVAVQRSGEPGKDNADIWIRGISTFAGNSSPLVLVDGVERSLNDMDPAEIESFTILKDASASAMYGVRGANGVILINTKRGVIGRPKVSLRVETALSEPTKLPKFVDAATYMEVMNYIAGDAGKTQDQYPFTQDRINKTRSGYDPDLYPNVNWIDEITRDYASNQRVNLSVNGGSELLRYSLVASIYNEKGIMERDKSQSWNGSTRLTRYNVRSNVDVDLTKTTLLRVNIGGYMQNLNKANHDTQDLFNVAFNALPYVHPTKYSSGEIPVKDGNPNPWALATQTGFQRIYDTKLESLLSLEQDFRFLLPGLKAKATFAFDSYSNSTVTRGKEPTYYNAATGRNNDGDLILSIYKYGQDFLGHEATGAYGNKSTYLEFQLNYSQNFGLNYIDALFLYNQRSYDDGGKLPYRNQGIAGRLSYSYNRRYITEFNFGYNGSENFAKGKRFGFFPSVALGWVLSEESFMESVKEIISKAKIRGSYGIVGNDKINGRRFAYITTLGTNNGYTWGTDGNIHYTGREEGEKGVSDLTWETVSKANLGFELGLFNHVDLNVDLYMEHRKNIFMQRSTIPGNAGFINSVWANYGKVDNKGIDISLDAHRQFGKDLFLSVRGSFTYAKNEIKEKDEMPTVVGTYRSYTGQSVSTLYGLRALGLFTEDDFADVNKGTLKEGIPTQSYSNVRPGDIRYQDMNGDGVINDEDKGPIGGTENPQIVYGFGAYGRYKNFDLSIFMQGVGKTSRIIGSDLFIPGSGSGVLGNIWSNYADRWTTENPSQDVFFPRLSESTSLNNKQPSTWWKKDMSFLRVKNIEFGYNFASDITKKIGAGSARLFISGNNLFCFSNFKLWDPEIGANDGLIYPAMRTFSVGFDITF